MPMRPESCNTIKKYEIKILILKLFFYFYSVDALPLYFFKILAGAKFRVDINYSPFKKACSTSTDVIVFSIFFHLSGIALSHYIALTAN